MRDETESEAPAPPPVDDRGVDLTLIDAMLAMTPRQRLAALYETASSVARMLPDDDRD